MFFLDTKLYRAYTNKTVANRIMKAFRKQNSLLTGKLVALERSGKYEEALAELKDIWEETNGFPNVKEFEPRMAAELILRCGSLIGFLGHIKQSPDAQEKSKNLLTEARSRFLNINNLEKIAECENYLALAYWRTGELVEAKTWLEEAFTHNLPNSADVRIYSHLIKSLISQTEGRFEETVINLSEVEADFRKHGDAFLNGSFCANFAIALKNLGRKSEALKKLELAKFYHRRSRHQIYLGAVENDLAQLYKSENKFTEAHRAIDNAAKIFKQIKDKTGEGFSLDIKAQIYFTEKKYNDALKTIEKAIKIFGKSENAGYVIETYLTKAKILVYLDDFCSAVLCLSDAVQRAKSQVSEEAALNLVREFELALEEKNSQKDEESSKKENPDSEDLQLVLPPSLAHYQDIQVIRIRNRHLEKVGLKKGSLAVVVNEKINCGDLTAISETETDLVSCGFYGLEFGIICLGGINTEPQLFEVEKVKIIGKIVGVCNSEIDGRMVVKPINI